MEATVDRLVECGQEAAPEPFDKDTLVSQMESDLVKLEAAAEQKFREHLVLRGKAQAFRETVEFLKAK